MKMNKLMIALAVMAATALLSAINSNTSTALIMMPMALAMLRSMPPWAKRKKR